MTTISRPALAAAVFLVQSTGQGWSQSADVPGDAAAGAEIYVSYCSACHGPQARGDGQMAAVMTVLPPGLRSLTAENGGVFPVARVARQIDGRDPLLAHGGVMPLFGDFFEGEDVFMATETGQPMYTSQAIADLIAFLQTVQD